jgi:hypothetical protein
MSEPEQASNEASAVPESTAGPGSAKPPSEEEAARKAKKAARRRAVWRTILIGLAFIAGFVVLGIAAILVWEYSNSVAFCSNACHDVHPEEPASYSDSYHAQVKCTECHMGRTGTLRGIVLKAGHFRHLPEVIFDNYDRPLESETLRPPNESCERCHWPESFHGDTVRAITRFQPDETNSEQRTYLILKTAGGAEERALGYGIHWHIVNKVEYIATDHDGQEIAWVRSTLPDGRTVEYSDAANPLTAEEIAAAEKKTMDCVDCHNRVGHPFSSPENLLDEALAGGRLSQDLPYIKQEMMELLTASYPDQEAALQAIAPWKASYVAAYPEAAATQMAAIDQAEQLAEELVPRLVFAESGITWRSFPDDGRHKDFPGCFRCHDGKHLSPEGESIRLHCNICHTTPVTVGADSRPPQMPVGVVEEPPSHLETNFIADHRFQASEACAECHGEINFGRDDSSFCASSSCHGRAWLAVDLDAAFPHPIPLEGKHAQVLCSECHNGEAKPEYKCSNCHQPPQATHFGDQCEDCHTPAGFEQATLADFQHPIPLEGAHAGLDCIACHSGGEELTYECANCHEPPSEPHFGQDCEQCHTPTGFAGATISPEQHPIPLVGAHTRAQCTLCHPAGQPTPEYVCSNCHKPPADHFPQPCDTCHTPEGWSKSAGGTVGAAPEIPHDLTGRDDCLLCHNPTSQIKPAPASHADYVNSQCTLCHKGE